MSLKQKTCQKSVACSYGCKLVFVDDNFSEPFKSNWGKDAVYNFINIMVEESKYCNEVMKKHFNKKNVMAGDNFKIFKPLPNIEFVIILMLMVMLK